MISETNFYELHHRARLAIKPGITGMWQVSGRSDITDFEEVVRLDKEYITNWNIGLDIKILFKRNAIDMENDEEGFKYNNFAEKLKKFQNQKITWMLDNTLQKNQIKIILEK